MDFKKIIKEYYEELYVHKLCNLNEADRFLERQNLIKVTQRGRDDLNRPIST